MQLNFRPLQNKKHSYTTDNSQKIVGRKISVSICVKHFLELHLSLDGNLIQIPD